MTQEHFVTNFVAIIYQEPVKTLCFFFTIVGVIFLLLSLPSLIDVPGYFFVSISIGNRITSFILGIIFLLFGWFQHCKEAKKEVTLDVTQERLLRLVESKEKQGLKQEDAQREAGHVYYPLETLYLSGLVKKKRDGMRDGFPLFIYFVEDKGRQVLAELDRAKQG